MTAKVQQTAWRSAKVDNTPIVEDDGDVYSQLRNIQQMYYDSANKLAAKLDKYEWKGDLTTLHNRINSLRTSGDRIGNLIPSNTLEALDAKPVVDSNVNGASGADQETVPTGNTASDTVERCQNSQE